MSPPKVTEISLVFHRSKLHPDVKKYFVLLMDRDDGDDIEKSIF